MYKYSFLNDYSEGAHPRILEALSSTNYVQQLGYGDDDYCHEAAGLIRQAVGNPDADVHFLVGGTQANLVMLCSFLRPYESVIAVDSGHICVHEAGSIEATGHKIHAVKGKEGKVTAGEIEAVVAEHSNEHMVEPRAVYISQSTEVGTIYFTRELKEISSVCKKHGLYLYLDGARLGSALTSQASDISLKEICSLVDAFYIGGTKNGALLGEAMVINHSGLKSHFRYMMKQRGALLAKGRIVGIQYLELFKDNLYYELARNANETAERLRKGIIDLGYTFKSNSPTNQIFPVFPDTVVEKIGSMYRFDIWEKLPGGYSSIRLVTSWATRPEAVDMFLADLKAAGK
jgi:threonine aldolase